MRLDTKKRIQVLALVLALATVLLAGCSGSAREITGRITAIESGVLTLELGTLEQPAAPKDAPAGTPPGEGEDSQMPQQRQAPAGSPPANPQGDAQQGDAPTGTPPVGEGTEQTPSAPGQGTPPQGGLGGFTTMGETQTVVIKDGVRIVQDQNGTQVQKSIEDLEIGDIVAITLSGGTATVIEIASMDMAPDGEDQQQQSTALTAAYVVDQTEQSLSAQALAAGQGDQSVVLV